jgi:hypothetical protein
LVKATALALVGVALTMFAVYVWPTRYWYTSIDYFDFGSKLARVDRFTGRVDLFMPERMTALVEQRRGPWNWARIPSNVFEQAANQAKATRVTPGFVPDPTPLTR